VLWLDVGHVTGHDDGKPSRVPTVGATSFYYVYRDRKFDPRVLSTAWDDCS